jgi:hypothetical protein
MKKPFFTLIFFIMLAWIVSFAQSGDKDKPAYFKFISGMLLNAILGGAAVRTS